MCVSVIKIFISHGSSLVVMVMKGEVIGKGYLGFVVHHPESIGRHPQHCFHRLFAALQRKRFYFIFLKVITEESPASEHELHHSNKCRRLR